MSIFGILVPKIANFGDFRGYPIGLQTRNRLIKGDFWFGISPDTGRRPVQNKVLQFGSAEQNALHESDIGY